MKDVTEFLAGIELNPDMKPLELHASPIRIPAISLTGRRSRLRRACCFVRCRVWYFKEMPMADLCCGSAGIYNVVQNEMSMSILRTKMRYVNLVNPDVIVTANPGCMLQLRGRREDARKGQPVKHVVEVLDEAYGGASGSK